MQAVLADETVLSAALVMSFAAQPVSQPRGEFIDR